MLCQNLSNRTTSLTLRKFYYIENEGVFYKALYTDYYFNLPKIELFTRSKPLGRRIEIWACKILNVYLFNIWGLLCICVWYIY